MPAHPAGKATPEPRSMPPTSRTTSDATTVVLAEPSCVAVEAQPAPGASPTPPKSSVLSQVIERQMLAAISKQVQQTSIKSSKPTVNRSKLCHFLLCAAVMTTVGVWALTVTRKLGPDESPTCQLTGTDSSWSTTSTEEIEAAALIADDWRYLLKMTRAYGVICLASSGLQLLGAVLVLCGFFTTGDDDSPEAFCCGCLQAIIGIFMIVYVIIFLVAFGEISEACEGHQDFEAVSSIHTYIMVVNIFIPASVLALCCCGAVVACALSEKNDKVLPFKP